MDYPRKTGLALWGVNLASISASMFCYIYLSFYIYHYSGNISISELVLMAPMLIPVVFVWQIHKVSNRFTPRTLMIGGNLLAMLICLLIFSNLLSFPYLATIGVFLIGALDAIQRVARIVAVKKYFKAEQVRMTVPLTLTAQFIAGGLAGGFLSVFQEQVSPQHAILITCMLFALAALFALALPRQAVVPVALVTTGAASSQGSAWRQFITLMRSHTELQQHFLVFILMITIFQGFLNVSRIALPAHQLGLSESYVGLLQIVSSVAALLGALLFYWGNRRGMHFPVTLLSLLSALTMIGACAGLGGVTGSYGMYFFYMFFFELLFFKMQSDIVSTCPSESMPLMATVQYAAVYLGMMLAILAGALLVSHASLLTTAITFSLFYFIAAYRLKARFEPSESKIEPSS
ncbi:TPA: MFS transporter [Serratia fonticola]